MLLDVWHIKNLTNVGRVDSKNNMSKTVDKNANSPKVLYLIGISVLVILLFGFVVIDFAKKSYNQAQNEGMQTSVRLANILAAHVDISFRSTDLQLRRTIERIYSNYSASNSSLPKYTSDDFKNWINETPQISAVAVLNETGDIENAAAKKGYEGWLDYKLSRQRLVSFGKNSDNSEVFIGKQESKDGNSTIIMSRRYNTPSGKFAGVVVAAISPQYFVDFYDSIASGNRKFMSIMLFEDGTVLASSPYNSKINELLGRNFMASKEKTDGAVYQQNATLSDSNVISAVKILHRDMPIAVNVIVDEDDFLANWKQARLKDFGFLILFVVFGSILSFFAIAMARQVMKVQESENAAILASQAKSEFLANMSHELRTPLNAIIGFSEMLNSGYFGAINDKQKERIHDINLCGNHLLQLINDILEFSKGDAGKLELIEEQVNLGELIDESVRIMTGKVKSKNIDLLVRIEPHLQLLWGDKRKVRQILINLISNSVKFTPEHGRITVSAGIDTQQNIFFSVSDTGIGITEADIPKALSVFGQVHRSQSHEGTGLGLPLCKMYAELHGGKLILTSKQNEGTTVKIVFPHQRTLPQHAQQQIFYNRQQSS